MVSLQKNDGFINEKNNIKYAGYFYDAETGLYYLNARFYDPKTARFIQQDSYSGNILDPLSLNLYTYGHNNPISYYDPTGRSIKSVLKKAVNKVKKAVDTVKAVVTVAKPVVKQTVKTTATVAVTAKVRMAVGPVVSLLKSVQAKTENKRQTYQENTDSYALQGSVEKAIAGFDQGLIDGIDSGVNSVYKLYDRPSETIKDVFGSTLESLSYESRINRYKTIGQNYANANKSGYTGISAVTYNMGRGFPEFALTVASGMKGSPQAGKGTKPPTGGNSIRNAFNSPFNGSPQLAGANGMVISGAVSAEASVSPSVSAGALGVRAGVAAGGTMAAGGVVYASKNSGQSSGGSSQISSSNQNDQNAKQMKKLNEWLSNDKELLKEVTKWYNDKPEWWGIDSEKTDVFYRTQAEVREIRNKPGESVGHHPHGLGLGGPEGQILTPTGETAIIKNPTHSQVTGLQRRVINNIKKHLK